MLGIAPSFVPLLLFALWSCSSPGRVSSTDSWPACPGLRAPVILGESTSLSFCDMVTGVSCCDADEDEALREQFEAMNVVADAACTTVVKSILCKNCIPSSSPLPFNTPPAGSTTAAESIPPRCAAATSSLSSSQQDDGDATICVERIGAGSYLDMAAHPDGSGRAFLSTQDGKIWLATIPEPGSGDALQIHDEAANRPFLDLTDRVLGLMGVAFHPEFATNRRFFVSYTCDNTTSPACVSSAGTAAGNGSTTTSSQYQLVVAEFSAKSKATRADPTEVRRIFTMDLPPQGQTSSYSQQQHGGQILFRPSDGYLYLMTVAHGGDQEANHGEFSSNKSTSSFLGKIVRFNIDDNMNGQSGGGASNRTVNRSGTAAATEEVPEIFAVGLGDPRGCSFDSARPSYLFCASVDEQQYESVHLIGAPSANAAVLVVGYGWRSVSGTPSIVGGRVYRGSADPSLEGRYLYMYGASAWAAEEAPASSWRYVSAQIPIIMCSGSSPAPCTGGAGVHGRVVSFGEDNSNDAFILATGGVYRVVEPSFCRARRSRSSAASALPWLLSVGACALVSAFYICWKVFAGGQRPAMNCNGWLFRCFACIVCPCCNCCNNVMNIGPGAGNEAGLQLGP